MKSARRAGAPNLFLASFVALILLFPQWAISGVRYSVMLGYGKSTVQRDELVGSSVETFNRAESPVAFLLSADLPLGGWYTFGVEHSRGFSLAPLSSGVSFTGVSVRRYLLSPVPAVSRAGAEESTLIRRQWSLYGGLGAGIASASVSREYETVETIKDTGFYFAPKLGAEIQWLPGLAGHLEIQMPSASGSVVAQGSITGLHVLLGLTIIP